MSEKLKPRVRRHERELIREALNQYKTHAAAAAVLGISTETIRKKLLGK